ncbi:MAG: phosphate signaling complex protein PhoU [Planctomycetota bacterium]|nr:phosphate signaling complex protein PhoU [Planctomycetota bacterium]MDA1262300.1 phosphate signaling complex protein PhoU [Planctomycetota bacterium]
MPSFSSKLNELQTVLHAQGDRVLTLVTLAIESYFDHDETKARTVVALDDEIDSIDVAIERASIPLLAMGQTNEHAIRQVLTLVKVNNELERIADCGVNIAEQVVGHQHLSDPMPPTFRVMANSVLGMLRDSNRALATSNAELARQVLLFDDTVDRFRNELILQAQEQVALGTSSVHFAFRVTGATRNMERIADHSTNICEQTIYLLSGKIVRHRPEGWSDPAPPESD